MRPRFIQDGTKVGGERRPRGIPNKAVASPSRWVIEASWGQVGANMKQHWSPSANTIDRRRRKDGANASPSRADLETTWGQVGAKTKRRWPITGMEPKMQKRRSARTYGKTYVFGHSQGRRAEGKWSQDRDAWGHSWAPIAAYMRLAFSQEGPRRDQDGAKIKPRWGKAEER